MNRTENFDRLHCPLPTAGLEGGEPDPAAGDYPAVMDGVRGVRFIEAAVESSHRGGIRVDATVSIRALKR